MTDSNFTTVISNFVADTEKKGLAIIKTAIKATIKDAQTPVAKGGKMRVDTGFLRSSGIAQIGQIPSGPTVGRDRRPGEVGTLSEYGLKEDSPGQNVDLAIINLKAGETFYFGWTARYAKYREAKDGFLESAVQKWQSFIDTAVGRLKK